MICIENLSKTYHPQGEPEVHALQGASLKLGNKGLVFIVGRSGSGKSTLLNMIGGLDQFDAGEITVDGNVFSKMTPEDFAKYRASYMGFVFQDYSLIHDLNVYDNVRVALDINDISEADELILETLQLVGLSGMGKRMPKELSGGQKQRVAIARAIVKKPRLILCDEPTGNLDHKTSAEVLEILQSVAKETLVLIVSHSMDDAQKYGDRIIEIEDGRVKDDYTLKTKKPYRVEEDTLFITGSKRLSEEDVEEIDRLLPSLKTVKVDEDNRSRYEESYEEREVIFSRTPTARKLPLSMKLFKKRAGLSAAMVGTIGILLSVFGVCYSLSHFDMDRCANEQLGNLKDSAAYIFLEKVYHQEEGYLTYWTFPMDQKDVRTVERCGSDASLLYNVAISNRPGSISGLYHGRTSKEASVQHYFNGFYPTTAIGTRKTNFEEIKYLFDWEDKYSSLDEMIIYKTEYRDYGVYITDYTADSIIAFDRGRKPAPIYTSYQSLLGKYTGGQNGAATGYINGIINTGYKEYVKSLGVDYNAILNGTVSLTAKEYDYGLTRLFFDFSINYTLEDNFDEKFAGSEGNEVFQMFNPNFDIEGVGTVEMGNNWFYKETIDKFTDQTGLEDIEDDAVGMSYNTFKSLFPSATAETYEAADAYLRTLDGKITISAHQSIIQGGVTKPILYDPVPVKLRCFSRSYGGFYAGEKAFTSLANGSESFYPYATLVKMNDRVFDHYSKLSKTGIISSQESALATVGKAQNLLEGLSDLFDLIGYVCVGAAVILMVLYGRVLVSGSTYDIGVMKANGMSMGGLVFIYLAQLILVSVVGILFSSFCLWGLKNLANEVVVNSFLRLMGKTEYVGIHLIFTSFWNYALNAILIFVITALSTLIPILILKKVKPIDIIRKAN